MITGCDRCSLCKTRRSIVQGEGPQRPVFAVIGEAPGVTEDETGRPFVGRSGLYLRKLLKEAGIDPRECWIDDVIKCHPPNNRPPTDAEIESCRRFACDELRDRKPKVIICVGKVAARAILGVKNSAKMLDLAGQWFNVDWTEGRPPALVIYHSSFLMQHGRRHVQETVERLRIAAVRGGVTCPK